MKPPTLAKVEAKLGPASSWAGRCYEIACACVEHGFIKGTAVYGHWCGPVNPKSYFGTRGCSLPFVRHGWVLLPDGRIFDPTRWAFTGRKPSLYIGRNRGEYDEGGDKLRQERLVPAPTFEPGEKTYRFTKHILPATAWSHVEKLLGSFYLTDLGVANEPGDVTTAQLFWLANLPYAILQPHARAVYEAIEKLGRGGLVPIDNYRRAQREKA